MSTSRSPMHSVESTSLADLLERILDKGVVVAGDISVKLVEVELLTIQLRLVICSVDKACELGLDWWKHDGRSERLAADQRSAMQAMDERLGRIEQALGARPVKATQTGSATHDEEAR